MTPEQLEEIQGIGPKMVEHIQEAVNSTTVNGDGGEAGAEAAVAAAEEVVVVEEVVVSEEETSRAGRHWEAVEARMPPKREQLERKRRSELSGTIEDAGSPTNNPGPRKVAAN